MVEVNETVKKFWDNKPARYTAIGLLCVGLLFGVRACNGARKANDQTDDTEQVEPKKKRVQLTAFEEDQKRLISRFGEAGEGYYWSDEGTRMALGDQNLSESEVIATYLKSISTLDFATAQKYAYKDQVLRTVNAYFNSDAEFTYSESFKKAMYQQFLLSIETEAVESQATFADDRANVTVRLKALDLSNKDFWKEDEDQLHKGIYTYRKTEADSTKARNFLYDYVLKYWKSEKAKKKEITVNLTLMKTGAGGWLVSNDQDIDNYAKYSDGETVINNILKGYDDMLSGTDGKLDTSDFDETVAPEDR